MTSSPATIAGPLSISTTSMGPPSPSLEASESPGSAKPSWASQRTKAGKERRRLPMACFECRKKKVKCSGELAGCQHCAQSRLSCVYKSSASRKSAARTDRFAQLDERLDKVKQEIIRSTSPESLGTSNRSKAHPGKEGAMHLPSMEMQEHLSQLYFDYLYGQPYYLFHRPTYFAKLRSQTLPPIIVLAVCAVAARFSDRRDIASEPACVRGEQWAAPAREMILRNFDEPNISAVTVYLLLGLHEFGAMQGGRSWMLAGMASRMAFALQLHKEVEKDDFSITDRELRRRTMWSCLMMDRFTASGTERPEFVHEEDIQIDLPICELKYEAGIPPLNTGLKHNPSWSRKMRTSQLRSPDAGVAAFSVEFIILWGRVIRYLNLGGREKDPYPVWAPQSQHAALKASVHQVQSFLPVHLLYTPFNLQAHAAKGLANQFIFMHVTLHQIKLFLNRAVCPALSGKAFLDSAPPDFVEQAGQAAVEAADQVSLLLVPAIEYKAVAPFIGYSAFLSSAVHIWTLRPSASFRKSTVLRSLATNIQYLNRIRRYWGIFNFMAGNLRDIYRKHLCTSADKTVPPPVLQFGDWFAIYPCGSLRDDLQDQSAGIDSAPREDSSSMLRSDIQTIEDFFQHKIDYQPSYPDASMQVPGPDMALPSTQNSVDNYAGFPAYAANAFIPRVDRQVVSNAYGSIFPSAATQPYMSTSVLAPLEDYREPAPLSEFVAPGWSPPEGMPGAKPAAELLEEESSTSAWFMPFNMHFV